MNEYKNIWGFIYLLLFFIFLIGWMLIATMQELTKLTGRPIPYKIEKIQ